VAEDSSYLDIAIVATGIVLIIWGAFKWVRQKKRTTALPPTKQEVLAAQERRQQLIISSRAKGFPDGLFAAAKGQRFGRDRKLVSIIRSEEVFPDVSEEDRKQAEKKVYYLMNNSFGEGLLGGKISHAEAMKALSSQFPGFSDDTYGSALMVSGWNHR